MYVCVTRYEERWSVCEASSITRLRMYSAVSVMRVSVGESEHVFAQLNVWEMRSEKQMADLTEEEREEGRVMMSQPTTSIISAVCVLILSLSLCFPPFHPPSQREKRRNKWGG